MKNNTMRQTWRLASAALGGVLLMAGAGCNCVSINIGGTPAATSAAAQAGPPAGGNFVPVQAVLASSSSVTVCGQSVPGSYVRFYPPTQTPTTGNTGFRGSLWNVTAGAAVPNTDYLLQWFVNIANNGCCTPVSGSSTDVSCPVTAGLGYRFTAFFKTGHVPPANTTIQLSGAWTQ